MYRVRVTSRTRKKGSLLGARCRVVFTTYVATIDSLAIVDIHTSLSTMKRQKCVLFFIVELNVAPTMILCDMPYR